MKKLELSIIGEKGHEEAKKIIEIFNNEIRLQQAILGLPIGSNVDIDLLGMNMECSILINKIQKLGSNLEAKIVDVAPT